MCPTSSENSSKKKSVGSDMLITPEEFKLKYKIWKTKGHIKPEKKIITIDEYHDYIERSSFRCPYNRDIRFCNGRDCPTRPEDFTEDYWCECVSAGTSKMRLKQVANGKILVHHAKNDGWAVSV